MVSKFAQWEPGTKGFSPVQHRMGLTQRPRAPHIVLLAELATYLSRTPMPCSLLVGLMTNTSELWHLLPSMESQVI